METVKRINEWMCKIENALNSIALVAVLLIVTAQIVMRYVFNDPLIWSEELSRYLYVWIAWLGCAFCVGTRSHIRVPIAFDSFPPTVKKIVTVVGNFIIIVFFCYLMKYAFDYANQQAMFAASTLPIKRSVVFCALPVGLALSIVQLLLDTVIFTVDSWHAERSKL